MDPRFSAIVIDERNRAYDNHAFSNAVTGPHMRTLTGTPSLRYVTSIQNVSNKTKVNDRSVQTDVTSDYENGHTGTPANVKTKRRKRSSVDGEGDGTYRQNSVTVIKDACGTATNYLLGVFVRMLLVAGNVLAAWRTVIETGDQIYWLLVPVCTVAMMIEYAVVIFKKKGLEWTWWSPCFLVYLGATLPLVWEMQFKQRENYIASLNSVDDALRSSSTDGPASLVGNTTSTNTSSTTAGFDSFSTTTDSTFVQLQDISWRTIISISSDTWVIVVNESLVYLIIFSRWLLPRGEISRDFLADMLLEFLAIASDIMELLALFDEGRVRGDMFLNYWILTAWSISFIQFIPVLLHKRKYRRIQSLKKGCLKRNCGSNFTEVLATSMSIVLQDGSFLVLRLYIMVRLNFVTYSLTFFVMKNLLSLLLLFYRMIILFHNLPCCCGKDYKLSNSLIRTKTVPYHA